MPAEGLEPPTNGLQIGLGSDAQKLEVVKRNLSALFSLIFSYTPPRGVRCSCHDEALPSTTDSHKTPTANSSSFIHQLSARIGRPRDHLAMVYRSLERVVASACTAAAGSGRGNLRY